MPQKWVILSIVMLGLNHQILVLKMLYLFICFCVNGLRFVEIIINMSKKVGEFTSTKVLTFLKKILNAIYRFRQQIVEIYGQPLSKHGQSWDIY